MLNSRVRPILLLLYGLYLAYFFYGLVLNFFILGDAFDNKMPLLPYAFFFHAPEILFFLTSLSGYIGIFFQKWWAIYLLALAPLFLIVDAVTYQLYTQEKIKIDIPYFYAQIAGLVLVFALITMVLRIRK